MTQNKLNDNKDSEHTKLEGLLPWYVNGTLSAKESAEVEQHMTECKLRQSEALRCQSLVSQLTSSKDIWKPSPAHFAGILADVHRVEAEASAIKLDTNRTKTTPGFLQRMGAWISQTPRPVRWLLAFETFAFAGLALFVVWPQSTLQETDGVFETLSNAESPVMIKGRSIRLVFSKDMTVEELMSLLKQANAQIRQGPSEVGIYTVEVPAEQDGRALGILRAHPKVRLAQPVE
ncbi:MAG: zf-HC2 domain-containing protein [Methylobacter sp.]|nr:zf-HC2 domain-containing protein [Methylobacter sp.]